MPKNCRLCNKQHGKSPCPIEGSQLKVLRHKLTILSARWKSADFAGDGTYFSGKKAGMHYCGEELETLVKGIKT